MAETRIMTYQKAEYAIFEATARELNLSPAQLAKEIGYSDSTAYKWEHDGKMPKTAALACECLRRRRGNNGKACETWLIKLETDAQKHALEAICKGLGVEYVGV